MKEHNVTESRGFTLRYRPWVLVHSEEFEDKKAAMEQEKFYKSGSGREVVKGLLLQFLSSPHSDNAVSAGGGNGLKIHVSPVQPRPTPQL